MEDGEGLINLVLWGLLNRGSMFDYSAFYESLLCKDPEDEEAENGNNNDGDVDDDDDYGDKQGGPLEAPLKGRTLEEMQELSFDTVYLEFSTHAQRMQQSKITI